MVENRMASEKNEKLVYLAVIEKNSEKLMRFYQMRPKCVYSLLFL